MEKWNEKCIYLPHRLKKPVKVEEKPKEEKADMEDEVITPPSKPAQQRR